MNTSSNITCASCGGAIDESLDLQHERLPCTKCGATARNLGASLEETVSARDGLHLKAKRQGEKKPFVEDMSIPSYSFDRKKLVHRSRLIDRANDLYGERVTDYETDEVIHEDKSKLSEHIGHGSAKHGKSS